MQTITFSRNSFWFKYWKFVSNAGYVNNEPKDTCSLRKELIMYTFLVLFALPFSVIIKLLQLINSNWKESLTGKFYIVIAILLQVIILSGSFVAANEFSVSLFLGYLYAVAYIIGSMAIIISIAFIIVSLLEKFKPYKINRPGYNPRQVKRPNIIVVLYNTAKNQLCSKITYID